MAISANAAAPKGLYLVGSFNNWSTPDTEAGRGYVLTDEDADDLYIIRAAGQTVKFAK